MPPNLTHLLDSLGEGSKVVPIIQLIYKPDSILHRLAIVHIGYIQTYRRLYRKDSSNAIHSVSVKVYSTRAMYDDRVDRHPFLSIYLSCCSRHFRHRLDGSSICVVYFQRNDLSGDYHIYLENLVYERGIFMPVSN